VRVGDAPVASWCRCVGASFPLRIEMMISRTGIRSEPRVGRVEIGGPPPALEDSAEELLALVKCLSMGDFYVEAIGKHLSRPSRVGVWVLGDPIQEARQRELQRTWEREYREQLRTAVPAVERLVVEMLDFQTWDKDHGSSQQARAADQHSWPLTGRNVGTIHPRG